MAIEGFVAALLAASRFEHTGRGREMRDWVQRSAQAWLAGERIYATPEIKARLRPGPRTPGCHAVGRRDYLWHVGRLSGVKVWVKENG